jgi:hypothetical protein
MFLRHFATSAQKSLCGVPRPARIDFYDFHKSDATFIPDLSLSYAQFVSIFDAHG